MRLELAEMLDGIQRRPAEHAWIKTCRSREATRGHEPRPEIDQLEHLVINALDHCVFMGWMTARAIRRPRRAWRGRAAKPDRRRGSPAMGCRGRGA